MRLSLTVLLVTLALCCYEANAVVCPSFAVDNAAFLWVPDLLYRARLQTYSAPREAVEAKMQVKQCVNGFSTGNKLQIWKALVKILLKCGYEDFQKLLSFVF
ncbi:secretoglobin family 1D member-like [Vicugna pacos]|uniref:Uteroglobin n=1 Tax=Vicugna pacos TaxID=30538 RepID=A0A6I9IL59_VICPA|nr:secretoglobin family 1D member-like [Vicugna pacos]